MSIWKKILIGLLIAIGLYYFWGLYLIVFRGYDSYWAGTIYSSEDMWEQKQIGLSLAEEMHRLKHEEHWSDEEVIRWGDEMARKHQKEIDKLVVFPWIYYPAKWESERFLEKYGTNFMARRSMERERGNKRGNTLVKMVVTPRDKNFSTEQLDYLRLSLEQATNVQ